MKITFLVVGVIFFLGACGGGGEDAQGVRVFYFDAQAGEMSYAVTPQLSGGEQWVGDIIYRMQGQGDWPDAELLGAAHADAVFTLAFDREFLEQPPLRQAKFRASSALTLTDLPFVNAVEILVLDESYYTLATFTESATTVSNNPQIGAVRLTTAQFILFTIDESGETLVAHTRYAVDIEHHNRDRILMEMLVEDSPAIPAETQVRDVISDRDMGVVYVDLSGDFVRNFSGGTAHARLMLASIVHTMIENTPGPRTRRVFILIDSERHESFHGVGDFHLGFTVDDELLGTEG